METTTEDLAIALLNKPYLDDGEIIGYVKRVKVIGGLLSAEVEKFKIPSDPKAMGVSPEQCATNRLFSSVTFT